MKPGLIFSCIIFWCIHLPAQYQCGLRDTLPLPGAIFGPDRLLVTGADTLVTPAGRILVYSCRQGQITCTNAKGQKLWADSLPGRLIYFRLCPGAKIKGGDVVFQYNDKRLFVLSSKHGRMKLISPEDVILGLPKVGSRHKRKRM